MDDPPEPSTLLEAPSTPTLHLSRDQRLQVQTLRLAGQTYTQIADLLSITYRQVAYSATSKRVTPSH
jgi:hypothetical protein